MDRAENKALWAGLRNDTNKTDERFKVGEVPKLEIIIKTVSKIPLNFN